MDLPLLACADLDPFPRAFDVDVREANRERFGQERRRIARILREGLPLVEELELEQPLAADDDGPDGDARPWAVAPMPGRAGEPRADESIGSDRVAQQSWDVGGFHVAGILRSRANHGMDRVSLKGEENLVRALDAANEDTRKGYQLPR